MSNEGNLSDLSWFDSSERTIPVLAGGNMGHMTLKMSLSIKELIDMTRVYNARTIDDLGLEGQDLDAQRPLYESHAKSLAQYIVIGLVETNIRFLRGTGQQVSEKILRLQEQLGKSEYSCLQPFVTNIRDCKPDGSDLKYRQIDESTAHGIQPLDGVVRVVLNSKHVMSVVDGQHRRFAFDMVMKWLMEINNYRKFPEKGIFNPKDTLTHGNYMDPVIHEFWRQVLDIAVTKSTVSVECHLGATAEQERQIFSDLNSKGKKVELSQALEYDTSNPVNAFIKDELIGGGILEFETKIKDSSNWQLDDGKLLRKDLNPVTTLVLFGKVSSRDVTPSMVNEHKSLAKKYWEVVQGIPGFAEKGSRIKTIAAQPVVLKALARLVYDLGYGQRGVRNPEQLKKLWEAIESGKLNFSHSNPHWRTLMQNADEREVSFPGLSKYVHVPSGTNLDAGTYDETHKWVRYGSKHNDIYPRIGDLIRFQLEFDPRPSVTRSIAKEQELGLQAA
ncbi:MAG: DNA sulfur modification protein DndB [Halioglobus sp.]